MSLSQQHIKGAVDWINKTVDTLIIFNDTVSSYQLKLEYKKFAVPFTAEEKEL